MKRANISDVAARAGVSTATVSRVLNDPERVTETTRGKVLEAISELNFVKSATAFSFKVSQTYNVLVMVANVGSIYYSEVFEGLQRKAEESGYSIIISSPPLDKYSRQVTDRLRSGRVDGVIVLDGIRIDPPDYELLCAMYNGAPPVVGFSEQSGKLSYPHVYIDNRATAREATEHLIAAGHRLIGHVTGPSNYGATKERIAGFSAALEAAGLEVRQDFVFRGGFKCGDGRAAARKALKLEQCPTAFFCANDEVAMGLMSEFAKAGFRLPEDISVVGYDDICVSEAYVPALTTIRQPRLEIGAATMELLLEVIRDPIKTAGRVVKKELQLITRDSVAPPKNR